MKFSIKDVFSKCDKIRRKHFLCSVSSVRDQRGNLAKGKPS